MPRLYAAINASESLSDRGSARLIWKPWKGGRKHVQRPTRRHAVFCVQANLAGFKSSIPRDACIAVDHVFVSCAWMRIIIRIGSLPLNSADDPCIGITVTWRVPERTEMFQPAIISRSPHRQTRSVSSERRVCSRTSPCPCHKRSDVADVIPYSLHTSFFTSWFSQNCLSFRAVGSCASKIR